MSSNTKLSRIDELLGKLKSKHEHYTVKGALIALNRSIMIWYFYFYYGLAIAIIPFVLSFYNAYFAKNDKDFFFGMWICYLIGLTAMITHIYFYFKYALFCTPTIAYNHMMEMCMMLCFRGMWWSAIQAWTWSKSLWYLIPILAGFALECVFYLVVLWGRHIRTCSEFEKESNCEHGKGLRSFMLVLDLIWVGSQLASMIIGVMFDDELQV